MKSIIIICIAGLLALPVFAQQKEAKDVLDKTSANFRKAGGVEAGFTIRIKAKGQTDGLMVGTIRLKGDKFVLKTTDAITWFDGETQWSYLTDSEEVNISNPTEEELQGINPYALLSIYEKGFSYVLGKTRTYQGRSIYEVVLTPTDKTKEMSKLILYVAKDTYQPLYILAELNNGSRNEITITSYRAGQKFDDSIFVFDKKQYPRAEIIDLR
ncbi:LolA-like putative outer membrane lipoprotein chaperone [Bacteroides sp. 51]|uniref:LolA-like putative outer membrane lipoprotein chaperone n=1 Tax=Bacteroides sp. 51 TaxID=2302938 RepID=UPI0013D40436|nr:LolA-like putative outer membrane lipoprotein chaperone [Bacteroides sp. 51]NDV84088.1 hypothetical protein [Bacteroides sp. 51]